MTLSTWEGTVTHGAVPTKTSMASSTWKDIVNFGLLSEAVGSPEEYIVNLD